MMGQNTNKEFAEQLRRLADKWERLPKETRRPWLGVYVWSKDEGVALIRAIGGRWTKSLKEPNLVFTSRETGLEIQFSQSQVCRLVEPAVPAKYECGPLLSPQEEAELIEEAAE
jgi:hypothetical protein